LIFIPKRGKIMVLGFLQTEAFYEELIREKMGLEWAEEKGWQRAENRF